MISFAFTDPGNLRVQAFLKERTPRIITAVEQRMWTVMRRLANYIATDKLSGQVLNVRTGTLRRAVLSTVDVRSTTRDITGVVGIPKEAWYGKVHEFGAQIPEVDNKLMVFQSRQLNLKFRGVPGADTIFTMKHKAFKLPERSFMRTALREKSPEINLQLADAAERAAAGI